MTVQGWHPVALSRDIEPGTSAGTVLDGREIAIWRDTKGTIHAWEDRCPHRGMKLSFGFVRGDHIACLYHGWEYGSDGRCRKIPAHPALDVPASIRVPSYAVAEAGGMVLVSFDSAPPPVAEVGPFVALRSLFLDCPLDTAITLLQSADSPFGAKSDVAINEEKFAFCGIGFPLRIGLHTRSPKNSALHITVGGNPSVPERLVLIDQTAAFRRQLERVNA